LHSKVDGPAAYDILTNFEERWLMALKMTTLQKMKTSHDDSLLKIDRISDIIGIDDVPCLDEHNKETWHVQVSLIEFSFPLRNFFNINFDVSSDYLLHFFN
jgi:phospholipase D1/2